MYKFALLDPRPIPAAQTANDSIFEKPVGVLGIEVSIPSLAARCVLGNIDPQHTGYQGLPALDPQWARNDPSYTGEGQWQFSTAIQLATCCALPLAGATLATIRPDLDSFGAMAVLAIRAEGAKSAPVVRQDAQMFCPACGAAIKDIEFVESPGDYYECSSATCGWREDTGLISAEVTRRIWQVAAADKFARGGWPGKQSLPTTGNPWPSSGAADATRELAAIGAVIADFKISVGDRVEMMRRWLLTGEEPAGYRDRVEAERVDMIRALEDGSIKVGYYLHYDGIPRCPMHGVPYCADCDQRYPDDPYVKYGPLAVVVSTHRAATAVGYAMAPVVIAANPRFQFAGGEPHLKVSICQFTTGYVDLGSALAELKGKEEGWGGSPTFIGSPQGVSTKLALEEIEAVVARHLTNK